MRNGSTNKSVGFICLLSTLLKLKVCITCSGCDYVEHLLYLVTVEHLVHHAFMFRGVVAVVGGCEGPVRTGAEEDESCH